MWHKSLMKHQATDTHYLALSRPQLIVVSMSRCQLITKQINIQQLGFFTLFSLPFIFFFFSSYTFTTATWEVESICELISPASQVLHPNFSPLINLFEQNYWYMATSDRIFFHKYIFSQMGMYSFTTCWYAYFSSSGHWGYLNGC